MASPVPTPVAAAIGLVPTVLSGVRRLPGKAVHTAVQLPVLAVSSALAGLDLACREYDDLAERGEHLLARLRGQGFDELEDVVEDSVQGTPLARPYDAVEDALEDAVDTVRGAVSGARTRAGKATSTAARTADKAADKAETAAQKAAGRTGRVADDALDDVADTAPAKKAASAVGKAGDVAGKAADKAGDVAGKAADKTEKVAGKAVGAAETTADKAEDVAGKAADKAVREPLPEAEQPKGAPTPTASQPDSTRLGTAASADVVEAVEQVADRVPGSPQAPLPHDELPLPDYDHMTLGSLRGRMRSLTVEQLVAIRDYEKAHADRLPVVTMLDNRIAKLASDAGAAPDGQVSDRPAPGQGSTSTGSKVGPASQGPVPGTAPHGVPGNSQQPR